MPSRTPTENKALAWYCEENNLIPQLSTHPTYYFRDREGNESRREIEHILADYNRMREAKRKGKKTGIA